MKSKSINLNCIYLSSDYTPLNVKEIIRMLELSEKKNKTLFRDKDDIVKSISNNELIALRDNKNKIFASILLSPFQNVSILEAAVWRGDIDIAVKLREYALSISRQDII